MRLSIRLTVVILSFQVVRCLKYVTVSVRDGGIGIPERETSDFQKFSRLDNALSRKTEGTGLGLYLTKAMCRGASWLYLVYRQQGRAGNDVYVFFAAFGRN